MKNNKTNEEWIEEILQKKDNLVPEEHRDYGFNKLIKEAMLLAMKFKDEAHKAEMIELVESIPKDDLCKTHACCGVDIKRINKWKQEQLNKLNQ